MTKKKVSTEEWVHGTMLRCEILAEYLKEVYYCVFHVWNLLLKLTLNKTKWEPKDQELSSTLCKGVVKLRSWMSLTTVKVRESLVSVSWKQHSWSRQRTFLNLWKDHESHLFPCCVRGNQDRKQKHIKFKLCQAGSSWMLAKEIPQSKGSLQLEGFKKPSNSLIPINSSTFPYLLLKLYKQYKGIGA